MGYEPFISHLSAGCNPLMLTIDFTSGHRTVDGRNPAPVEVGTLSRYLQCLNTRWCRISGAPFLPSFSGRTKTLKPCHSPSEQTPMGPLTFFTLGLDERNCLRRNLVNIRKVRILWDCESNDDE